MTKPATTLATATLEKTLARVPKGTPRHRVLSAAHQFKTSWVELGAALWEVKRTHAYKEWGYPQFSLYCRQELHIREETARKLTRSFGYLQEHAPSTLAQSQQGHASTPSLDVVDLLRQARARTQVDEAAWAEVQRDALAPAEGHLSRAQVLVRLREACPAAFPTAPQEPVAAPIDAAPREHEEISPVDPTHARKVLLLAERLHALLAAAPSLADATERAAVLALAKSLRRHAGLPKAATGAMGTTDSASKLYSEGSLH